MRVKHTWPTSKEIRNDSYSPMVQFGTKVAHLSGLDFWELSHAHDKKDSGYLEFVNSRNINCKQVWAMLSSHDLAAFCVKFLLAYEGGWVFRDAAGKFLQNETASIFYEGWFDSIEDATIFNVESVFEDQWPDPDGEWMPYAVAERLVKEESDA